MRIQHFLPAWFMALSAADTRWTDLLRMLATLNDGIEYSEKEVNDLTWQEKTKLVQKDPFTCSKYFDHRVQEFLNTVLKSACDPVGKVKDFFYRVEFQQHGSPHIHMLVWIENAQTLEKKKSESSLLISILHVILIMKKLPVLLTCRHINTQELVERRENQYVGLDFHCLHFQKQCCYIHLKKKLKSTNRNTQSFRKL